MNNFCIITNECKDKGLRITKRLMEYILKKGGTATAFQCSEQKEPRIAVRDIPQDTQVILVLGGDGTLIRVATQVEGPTRQVLLLPISPSHITFHFQKTMKPLLLSTQ